MKIRAHYPWSPCHYRHQQGDTADSSFCRGCDCGSDDIISECCSGSDASCSVDGAGVPNNSGGTSRDQLERNGEFAHKHGGTWSTFLQGFLCAMVLVSALTGPPSSSHEGTPKHQNTKDTHRSHRLQPFLGLAVDASKARGRYISASSMYAVVAAMKTNSLDVAVQQTGCQVLRYLAQHGNQRRHIRTAGGIAAVLAAMDLHAQDENIQISASYALANLATSNNKNGSLIVASNGASAIVTAMHQHWSSTAVQTAGCQALVGLGQGAYGHRAVIKARGLHAIRQAIRDHRGQLDKPGSICVRAEATFVQAHNTTSGRKQDSQDVLQSVWKFTRTSASVAWDVTRVSTSLAWDVTKVSALISTRLLRDIIRAI